MKKGRLHLWVDREIQLRFVLYVIVTLVIVCTIISSAVFYNVWANSLSSIVGGTNIDSLYASSVRKFIGVTVSLTFVFAVLAFLGTLIMSHKIAGPALRITKTLQDLQEGKETTFKLRKGDSLNTVMQELQGFAKQYGALAQCASRILETWQNTEVKDLSFNLALKELETNLNQFNVAKQIQGKKEDSSS